MICPACSKDALIVEYENTELDYCPACGGVWFDAGELELLLERAGLGNDRKLLSGVIETTEAGVTEKKRRCPVCRHKMKKVTMPEEKNLVTDICLDGHGIWFDGGEVHAMVKALAEKAPENEATKKALGFIRDMFKY